MISQIFQRRPEPGTEEPAWSWPFPWDSLPGGIHAPRCPSMSLSQLVHPALCPSFILFRDKNPLGYSPPCPSFWIPRNWGVPGQECGCSRSSPASPSLPNFPPPLFPHCLPRARLFRGHREGRLQNGFISLEFPNKISFPPAWSRIPPKEGPVFLGAVGRRAQGRRTPQWLHFLGILE